MSSPIPRRPSPATHEKLIQDVKAAQEALGDGKAAAGFAESYREFVSLPSAKKEFRKLFLGLSDEKKLPALFHCTTGKDRTGWAAAALLTLLGVPEDVVMEDYLRSNDYILPKYQKVIDAFVEAGGDREIPMALLGVRKEYLESAFDEMEKHTAPSRSTSLKGWASTPPNRKPFARLYLRQK